MGTSARWIAGLSAAAALSLTACGGSGGTSLLVGRSTAAGSSGTAIGGSSQQALQLGAGIHPAPGQTIVKARDTGGDKNEQQFSSRAPLDPCKLVTRAQAQAAIGQPILTQTEAPQGPTCIYRAAGLRSTITLAVEPVRFSTIAHQLRNGQRLTVAGHRAYCGIYGIQRLVTPVGPGRVLDVGAPCALAKPLAASAIKRLKA